MSQLRLVVSHAGEVGVVLSFHGNPPSYARAGRQTSLRALLQTLGRYAWKRYPRGRAALTNDGFADRSAYRSYEEQQEAIEFYLSWRNRTREISLEDWKSYRRGQKKVA